MAVRVTREGRGGGGGREHAADGARRGPPRRWPSVASRPSIGDATLVSGPAVAPAFPVPSPT